MVRVGTHNVWNHVWRNKNFPSLTLGQKYLTKSVFIVKKYNSGKLKGGHVKFKSIWQLTFTLWWGFTHTERSISETAILLLFSICEWWPDKGTISKSNVWVVVDNWKSGFLVVNGSNVSTLYQLVVVTRQWVNCRIVLNFSLNRL